jgi:anti-sigma factor RsiW
MEAGRLADLHAYVDDCFEPDERLAFEQRMAQDPALARRAALWRGQNSAIRAAFDGEGAKAFPISLVRHQNEAFARSARSGGAGAKPSGEQPPRASLAAFAETGREIGRPAARSLAGDAFRPWLPWRLGLAVLSVCLAFVWAPAATVVPGKRLGEAGVAAFRAFGRPRVEPVELATSDTAEAQAWLTTRLARPLYLPAAPSAVTLIGARIAPYPGAPAAFLFYRSQDRLVGLLVQSLDAPATVAPQLLAADGGTAAVWTWRDQGLALVGDLDAASLLKIATDFADLPAAAAQPMPERGW